MEYKFIDDLELYKDLKKLNDTELSKTVGVTRATIDNWRNGKTTPDIDSMRKFYGYIFRSGTRINKIKERFYKEDCSDVNHKVLFHGAKGDIIGNPDIYHSKPVNDFGSGFYCGESLEQSAMFVALNENSSLYIIDFCTDGLKGITFGVTSEWMMLIAYFRGRLNEYRDSEVIKELLNRISDADYIVAPIADNRMFEIINQFLDGLITDEQCRHCLAVTDLGNQYVFKTEKAMSNVKVLEHCFLAKEEKDYYLNNRDESHRMNNDKVKLALREYRNSGKYIEDILK